MDSSHSPLIDFIRGTIREQGPVSFAWFMEQALYHPKHGFYSSGRCAIGRRGDYFTNISVGSLFGRLLTAQFVQMWELLDRPQEFTIVEQGAHHGDFARDVLRATHEHAPEFFAALRYRIIEPFPVLQTEQAGTLFGSFREKIEWNKSLDQLPVFSGLHFSNELIDAMPVHLSPLNPGNGWKNMSPLPPMVLSLFTDQFQRQSCAIILAKFPRRQRRITQRKSISPRSIGLKLSRQSSSAASCSRSTTDFHGMNFTHRNERLERCDAMRNIMLSLRLW